jgi:hypothetical protein
LLSFYIVPFGYQECPILLRHRAIRKVYDSMTRCTGMGGGGGEEKVIGPGLMRHDHHDMNN